MTSLSALEVSRLTGVSLRQLQWWDETDVLSPDRGRNPNGIRLDARIYNPQEVLLVAVIAELRRRRFSLQRIRRVIAYLGRNQARLADLLAHNSAVYLVTDGGQQNNLTVRRELPDIVATRLQPTTTLDLGDIQTELFCKMRRGRAA